MTINPTPRISTMARSDLIFQQRILPLADQQRYVSDWLSVVFMEAGLEIGAILGLFLKIIMKM